MIDILKKPALILVVSAICVSSATPPIVLTSQEYFEGPGLVFLVFHNNYSGMQGGLQLIQRGERLLDSGGLLLTLKDNPGRSASRVLRRVVDRERSTATVVGEVTGLNLGYQIVCRTDGERILVTLRFDRPIDWSKVRQAGFRMFLYPPAYFQKSFQGESAGGVFPRQYNGEPVLLKSTPVLRVAQEDPERSISLHRRGGVLQLGDDRGQHPTAWFSVLAPIEPGSNTTEVELEIRPSLDPNWIRPPVIGVSQVGYHPRQPKRAVIELDPRDAFPEKMSLVRMTLSGDETVVKAEKLKPWGRFLHYQYATFDFSDVMEPGLYLLKFRGQTAGPFQISTKVYDQAWKPTLEVFLPVQMCHVGVREGNRTWHGPCHLDDALQAPEGRRGLDGYQQGKRETAFADYQHIPGLDWGGWHDAGDHDLPAGSIASTTLALVLAQEEFHPGLDQTSIQRTGRQVLLHVSDGEDDLLQQIEYGVEGLLASFRAAGHVFPGIIESTHDQYDHTGDPVNITDNRIFDNSLPKDQEDGKRSGKPDDRWAFTNRNTGLQYRAVQTLAAANRVLRSQKSALADECLAAARKIWDYEQTNPPVYAPGAYVPRGSNFPGDEIAATAELWLTTHDARYQKRFDALLPRVRSMSPEQFGHGQGWILVRLLAINSDPEYRNLVRENAAKWSTAMRAMQASNPYGIDFPSWLSRPNWKLDSPEQLTSSATMGFGWDLQTQAMHHYFLHKHLPDIFDGASLWNVVNFVLGCHPGTNSTYVSGVGINSPLAAYGFNRDDWSYIPGGVISGASFIRPDFIELKTFPYHFFQTEYVIHGAASYLFDVLAAEWTLDHMHP